MSSSRRHRVRIGRRSALGRLDASTGTAWAHREHGPPGLGPFSSSPAKRRARADVVYADELESRWRFLGPAPSKGHDGAAAESRPPPCPLVDEIRHDLRRRDTFQRRRSVLLARSGRDVTAGAFHRRFPRACTRRPGRTPRRPLDRAEDGDVTLASASRTRAATFFRAQLHLRPGFADAR